VKFDPLEVDVAALLSGLGINATHEGDRWIALCPSPDHNDSSPSWDMKDAQGTSRHSLHRCFACSYGGTATKLVADVIGIDEMGARAWIEEHAMGQSPIVQSIDIKLKPTAQHFQIPPEVVFAPLEEWPAGPVGYLTRRRIDAAAAATWHLGYATSGKLAGRIFIPVYDAACNLRSYTARTYINSPKRYLEPKREEHPLPGAIFGEQYWATREERDVVCIVEGAFNGIAVKRVAPSLAVAGLMGSQIELLHLQKLSTFRQALLLTDPDLAGNRAAEKLEMALARHLRIKRVILEPGTDADSIEPADLRTRLVQAYRNLA
jgi:5S rRNA maturation endonuclease (ribonuclease M5)